MNAAGSLGQPVAPTAPRPMLSASCCGRARLASKLPFRPSSSATFAAPTPKLHAAHQYRSGDIAVAAPRPGCTPRPRNATVAATTAAAGVPDEGGGGNSATAAAKSSSPLGRFLNIFNVFSDERCNSKLLALAVGQMLCSIATLIHDSYLPIYVHDELGLSTTKIGAVQGAAQFLCQISKGVSGVVGDILGSQTRVLVFGTFLTLACKPMFALLSTVYGIFGVTACLYWFFCAKLLDRLSKGIREAPTKAVMNELAKESGDAPDAAYGLRQSLATAGMLIGSTIASLTFAATGNNYILTFAVASVPPLLALLWLMANFREELFGVPKETVVVTVVQPPPPPPPSAASPPPGGAVAPPASSSTSPPVTLMSVSVSIDLPSGREGNREGEGEGEGEGVSAPPPGPMDADVALPPLTALTPAAATAAAAVPEPVLSPLEKAVAILKAFKPVYWQALAVVAVLYFARFDASFLSIRAKAVMPKTLLPMMTLVNTLIQMLLTAPLSRVSGASVLNRNRLLLAGFGFMVAADACFASPLTANPAGMFLGSAFIGLHMAMTHAITISMVSSYMPTGVLPGVGKLSGTAVSFTDLLLGFVLAASNAVAGILTDMTRAAGLGNTGCFMGGAAACVLSGLLLAAFERFGDLGRDDLVAARKKKGKGPVPEGADPAVKAKPE